MKKNAILILAVAIAGTLGLSSCLKEENLAPEITSAAVSTDNKIITVTFSEAVYAKADLTGNLDTTTLKVSAPEALKFTYTVDHVAGALTATVNLTITSVIQGTETFTVAPASATAIYDNEGLAMLATENAVSNAAAKDLGIIGNWLSEGSNVAPLLVTYFKVAKIEAEFKADFTYKVNQFNIGNTTTTPDLVFSGTFEIAKSTVGNIWTITCNQEMPMLATASGIFEIKTGPEVLWYEVAQTSGTQNVPATPAAGFGSTNGGTLGAMNIQKYVRVQ
jgi:hypothetical protein